MMRRLMIFAGLVVLLVIGGALTALFASSSGSEVLPVLTQTINPDASRSVVVPWKAEQIFLLIGFILFNLVGIAGTIALITWLLDRGIRRNSNARTAHASKEPARSSAS